jgi:hypothetical protein
MLLFYAPFVNASRFQDDVVDGNVFVLSHLQLLDPKPQSQSFTYYFILWMRYRFLEYLILSLK